MNYILAIDMGTTAFKAAVFDETGAECGNATKEYVILSPKAGWAEMDPSTYVEAFCEVTHEAMDSAGVTADQILTIGMSAQGETSIFLDQNHKVLRNAIVWFDTRASHEAKEIVAAFGSGTIQKHTGQVGEDAIWPGAKILWLKRHEPFVYENLGKIVQLKGYICYLLTGIAACEDSILGSSMYWDINTRKYWPEMLEFLGITEEQLPKICLPGENVGKITKEAAQRFGFSTNTTVNIGGIDLACGAIGTGNVRPGAFSDSTGSALCTMTMVDHIVLDPNMQMPCYCSAIPGIYMVHAYATGGMYMRWFRDVFGELEIEEEKNGGMNAYDKLDILAGEVLPGADGLIALPHLQGAGPPDLNADAKGCFFGLTIAHKKKHFVRAIMESVTMVLCRIIEATEALDVTVDRIVSLGGGALSPVWCQMKADATGRTLVTTVNNNSACCLGAAILAGVASGLWESVESASDMLVKEACVYVPNPQLKGVYADVLARYKQLMECLAPMFQ